MTNEIDIREDYLKSLGEDILANLLKDHTRSTEDKWVNIFWATDDYAEEHGEGYHYNAPITIDKITGEHGRIIVPRCLKSKAMQFGRTKEMAEVFTPSWMCNYQNNYIDETWFGRPDVFNSPDPTDPHKWIPTNGKIEFPEGKTWKDYVRDTRLEITCGEGPYLVSRYDTTTGNFIPLESRIGIIDRKLRIVSENTETSGEWLEWAQIAYQSSYGYEWQGDSLLLAREAMLISFEEYYRQKFNEKPLAVSTNYIAYIISWNLWQMDGLKGVIPDSCHEVISQNKETEQFSLFGESTKVGTTTPTQCPGCEKNEIFQHNGTYCIIRDWKKPRGKQKIKYIDTLK